MIEDAMIAANEMVARFLEATGHTSVYRIHDHPDGDKLLSLKRMMAIFGVAEKLPKEPEPKDMQRLMESMKGKEIEAVVQVMTLRSLPQACYSTENKGHFGIASTCYTISRRRSAAILISWFIGSSARPSEQLNKSQLKKQTEFLLRAWSNCSENGTRIGGNGKRIQPI